MDPTAFGLRVVGHCGERRRVVDHAAAFAAYARCDPRAEIHCEGYLSAFAFPNALRQHHDREGSERGYRGTCWAPWLWFDLDRPGALARALSDAARLVSSILDRYTDLGEDDLLIFLSGGKGVHVGLRATWLPEPSTTFHLVAREFAIRLAEAAGVAIDTAVYSKTRLFRAPNSRHARTGLHKRRLSLEEVMHLKPGAVEELARHPAPFDVPAGSTLGGLAANDWSEARRAVEARSERHRARLDRGCRLNVHTLAFIRDGAPGGERATRLFRAAANLAEFGCPPTLAHALLTEAALDSGLTPGETRRQIDSGLAHVATGEAAAS